MFKIVSSTNFHTTFLFWTDSKGNEQAKDISENVRFFDHNGVVFTLPLADSSIDFLTVKNVALSLTEKRKENFNTDKPFFLHKNGGEAPILYVPLSLITWRITGYKKEEIWDGDAVSEYMYVEIKNITLSGKILTEHCSYLPNQMKATFKVHNGIYYTEQIDKRKEIKNKLSENGIKFNDDYNLKQLLLKYKLVDKKTGEEITIN